MTFRILVTGSRDWDDWDLVFDVLTTVSDFYGGNITVVSGGAKGADDMATIWAVRANKPSEIYKADWKKHGKAAGVIRNIEMVKTKPDVVLAFIKNNSPGATHCVKIAREANIPVFLREA